MVDYSRRQAYPGYATETEYSTEREKGEAVLESLRETISADVAVETVLGSGKPERTISSTPTITPST